MRRILAIVLVALVTATLAPSPGPGPVGAAPAPPAVTCPAPLPGPRAVVQLAYVVLLRRCPDPAGAATWEASLRDGMATETFARRIASTPEARGIVVGDAYGMVLGRPASAGERSFWAGWLRPDATRSRRHDQLLAELAASAELYAAAGRSDARFVELVYERILGRQAVASERDYWVARLAATSDRRGLARSLLRLSEPLRATVTAAWVEVLGTPPTQDEATWTTAQLRADGDRLALSARLVGSAAFDARAQSRAAVIPGRYVALGDSYVVGEGNPPFVDDEGCGYTTSAYPEVARGSSELVPSDLDMAACSGATVLSLFDQYDSERDETYPGQISALGDGASPSLVTLTIGGNDAGFVSIVSSCLQVRNAAGQQLNPGYDDAGCEQLLDDAGTIIEGMRSGWGEGGVPGVDCDSCSLFEAVHDVAAAAPDATVVLVGYPPLMPPTDAGCSGPVRGDDGAVVDGLRWSIAPDDVHRSREVVHQLNALLRDAAEHHGVTYVDPAPQFGGHAVCSADPWIHGLVLSGGGPATSTFHPNRRGGVGVATALVSALTA